jgi:hypothetical protein
MFSRIGTINSATAAPLAVYWGNCCVIRCIATVNPGCSAFSIGNGSLSERQVGVVEEARQAFVCKVFIKCIAWILCVQDI